MKTNTDTEINWVYRSIREWERIRYFPDKLKRVSDELGDMFSILVKPDEQTKYIHAYPGYWKDRLYFHLINDYKDKEGHFKGSVVPVDLVSTEVHFDCVSNGGILASGNSYIPISGREAIARIKAWSDKDIRNKWIEKEVSSNTMYQAFLIPADNFIQNEPYVAYFALNPSDFPEKEYDADLILYCEDDLGIKNIGSGGESNTFYDTCRPVPPFKPISGELGLLSFVSKLKI